MASADIRREITSVAMCRKKPEYIGAPVAEFVRIAGGHRMPFLVLADNEEAGGLSRRQTANNGLSRHGRDASDPDGHPPRKPSGVAYLLDIRSGPDRAFEARERAGRLCLRILRAARHPRH